MPEREPHPDFLESELDPQDRESLLDIAHRLELERPTLRPDFRGDLRRSLLDIEVETPRHLRLLIAAYAGSGLILLAVVAIGVAGSGPLAAG